MRLKNWMSICAALSSCASSSIPRTIPAIEVCTLRPTRAICRDRRQSNDEYSKRWEELTGSICIPSADFELLLRAISE